MNSETPNLKLKVCNACKRSLPNHFFGLRKYSKDGLNPCCKECRNLRRRQAYIDPNNLTDPIFPLNEYNRQFLWSLPDSIKKESLTGLDLETLNPSHIHFIKKGTEQFHFTIKILGGAQYILIHQGLKDDFIELVLLLLYRLKIRLFHPADTIALANWGLTKPI